MPNSNVMSIINIVAVLLSPVIAVLVTIYIQDRIEKRKNKMHIFNTLIETRHTMVNDEMVRAFNMIDVVFCNDDKVRQLWREYFDLLSNDAVHYTQKDKKRLELVYEMAKVLGYSKVINHLDIDRVYRPNGIVWNDERKEEIITEVLRILKTCEGVALLPKEADQNPISTTKPTTSTATKNKVS